ncbi:hypothetical protein CIRMBP1239_00050 [Enterococcus cecorum]|uniref:hypothetical protein n=1 Tax=Enterococcus cecorum TaxID=44008 RepID=UPI0022D2BAEF|nr:hypothetical protein [Enterococcus cecorum]CAI3253530.1 hypothetical protein CIRMBP1223_00050 [Enterococcus cecorum]CAI3254979.1 hypothetical protein CIRMBP1239_00050 [Enterococcus cecorum]CAI3260025.1 hypothetical protein CIRMBP1252_00144 [Enterococcus cecorum]CAI3262314.1 hypothetical protein CIRMBP1260_00145 [Enterococcus cecorum]CAI3277153.1 hypothetical protein CIRMBP1227_00305 [Enterococcus cecorum]
MNTLTIILIVSTIVLLITNIVMFTIERKKKPTTPIYKMRAILDDDLESLLTELILFVNSVNVVSARYHESDDIYVVTIIYTED